MAGDEQIVRSAWRSLPAAGGLSTAERSRLLDGVLARHREPHRRYHTVAHVGWVLRWIDRLATTVAIPSVHLVRLAAIYHDAVYDPRASDNEARSADLAVEAARTLGWSDADAAEVHRLILATAGHEVGEGDLAAAVLLDADLAVLGAEPEAYRAYAAGVRTEYAHLDDATWRAGRPAVLRRFLDRPAIYATEPMRDTHERRARANLTAEIVSLTP